MATPTRRAIVAVSAAAQSAAPKIEETMTEPAAPAAPAIEPVDTESPDYKAGYQNAIDGVDAESNNYKAGYAAGLGAKGAEGGGMTEPTVPEEPAARRKVGQAAKTYELVAAIPNDKGFVADYMARCEQHGTVPTVQGAKAEYADVLAGRVREANARADKAEKALADETQSPAPVRLAGGKKPVEDKPVDDPKAAAAEEWDTDPGVRAGFTKKEHYVAYRAAQMKGMVR